MSRTTDVIVVGSGIAGLMAAYAAAKQGRRVKVVSEGMGSLSISAGCIDLLGYDQTGQRIEDPWAAIAKLPAGHPYSIVGQDNIKTALDEFCSCMAAQGLKLHVAEKDGKRINTLLPTVAGTLKPSWIIPAEVEADSLEKARRILIISVRGFRDCRPAFIASQLWRYPALANKDFDTLVLPSPFEDDHGRSLNALDLAHMADRPEGRDWLCGKLKGKGEKYDLALIPPMLGARVNSGIRDNAADNLGCPYIELLCIPPGVAGLRIRDAFINTLVNMNVEFYENATATKADIQDGKCQGITLATTGREINLDARAYVIATGGILSGGVLLEQGKASEAILGIDIPVPANVDEWSTPEVFGKHLISSIGVTVDGDMRAKDNAVENVFFAGRTIGGYDQAMEKSGHGVALATGWRAGQMAAEAAQKASGGDNI